MCTLYDHNQPVFTNFSAGFLADFCNLVSLWLYYILWLQISRCALYSLKQSAALSQQWIYVGCINALSYTMHVVHICIINTYVLCTMHSESEVSNKHGVFLILFEKVMPYR